MIIKVVWEDQLGVTARGFGPHELLLSCIVDVANCDRAKLGQCVKAHPAKGNSNVSANPPGLCRKTCSFSAGVSSCLAGRRENHQARPDY